DPNGAVIAGAQVTLTNERTKEKLTETASDTGEFSFAAPKEGEYILEVSAPYFKTAVAKHLRLSPDEDARAEIVMQVTSETVTVGIIVMEDTLLDDNGNGKTTFNSKQITSLPHG
ncbi:MAG: carboxypeptidase-like regulatory domain-containing protein, partial [Acidobacteria bacterium]|nr:carboxypeptidase-like regulatory domain-containing protein [Acidobacteriota bacterium]